MSTELMVIYAVFLLMAAAIIIFGGPVGRRHLALSAACGGGVTFFVRFILTDVAQEAQVMLQLLYIPFLVMATWLGLFLVTRLRNRK